MKEFFKRLFHDHCLHAETVLVTRTHGPYLPGDTQHTEYRETCCECGRITVGTIFQRVVRPPWSGEPIEIEGGSGED